MENTRLIMKGFFYPHWNITHTDESKSIFENLQDSPLFHSHFFKKDYPNNLHSATEFKDFQKAKDRIMLAIKNEERVMIYGDYDVDGTMGTSILTRTLLALGAKVSYRIPHRDRDGYGLKNHLIQEIHDRKVSLIITVDNGINAVEQVDFANSLGIDVIITDHHQPQEKIPNSYALINPKQETCTYPFDELCGAGIAFKFCRELLLTSHVYTKELEDEILGLAAIATVADCVPLIDENRLIVQAGLDVLKTHPNEGIKELCKIAKIPLDTIKSDTIGFQIGPRINASGRLDHAYNSVQLVMGNPDMPQKIEKLNETRKLIVQEALAALEDNMPEKNTIIILKNPGWPAGIIGLIAGRLCEKYALPTLALQEKEHDLVASCRAPEGFDIFAFLQNFTQYFDHFGGHKQAAGLSMKKEKFDDFFAAATKKSKEILEKNPIQKTLEIFSRIKVEEISQQFLQTMARGEPFGMKNEKPLFLLTPPSSIQWKHISERKHTRGEFYTDTGEKISLIRFFSEECQHLFQNHTPITLVVSIQKKTWNNQDYIDMEIKDILI